MMVAGRPHIFSIQPTYEELKPLPLRLLDELHQRIQPTYEELKLSGLFVPLLITFGYPAYL